MTGYIKIYHFIYWLIEAKWRVYVSVNQTIISSDNGLSPNRRQAIIWTNAVLLLIRPFRTKFQWNFNQNSNIFIEENEFENVVCTDGGHFVSASMC